MGLGASEAYPNGVIHAVPVAALEVIEDGEVVLAGGTAYTSEDKHDARYDAGSLPRRSRGQAGIQARNAAPSPGEGFVRHRPGPAARPGRATPSTTACPAGRTEPGHAGTRLRL